MKNRQDDIHSKLIGIRRKVLDTALDMKRRHVAVVMEQYNKDRQHYNPTTAKLVAEVHLRRLGCTQDEVAAIMASLRS